MNFPIQFGWQQIILILIALVGVALLISSIMSVFLKIKEVELLEDEQGNTYKRWRRYRKPRWQRGTSGIVILLVAILLLMGTSLIQAYLGFSGKIKVAHAYTTNIENMDHLLSVDLTLYNQDGSKISRKVYTVEGDTVALEAHIVRFQSWINFLGVHSGYKITRLYGKYDSGQASKQNDIWLSSQDTFYQDLKNHVYWSNPFVEAAYGNAVILPAGDYDIFIENNAITAVQTN
jgi:hypothetical protein